MKKKYFIVFDGNRALYFPLSSISYIDSPAEAKDGDEYTIHFVSGHEIKKTKGLKNLLKMIHQS